MSGLQAVVSAYEQIDRHLMELLQAGTKAGDGAVSGPVDRERQMYGQAFFLLAWGQLEAEITDACRNAIRAGQSQRDWRNRRAWSVYNPDDRRLSGLSFENRLTFVLDRNDRDWRRMMDLYNTRNRVAHGDLGRDKSEMSRAIRDLVRVQSSLSRD